MPFSKGADAIVTLGGTDISEYLTSFEWDTEREEVRKKVLGGNPDVVFSLSPGTNGTT
jgi:hypothetical protein